MKAIEYCKFTDWLLGTPIIYRYPYNYKEYHIILYVTEVYWMKEYIRFITRKDT